jgi:hypothetical protein
MNGFLVKLTQKLAQDVNAMIGKLNKLSKNESYKLHKWVRKNLGKANHCEFNKDHKAIMFHWANRSNEYKKEFTDWISLCPKCHHDYDMNYRKKMAKKVYRIEVDYSVVAESLNMSYEEFMKGLEIGLSMFDHYKGVKKGAE